MLFLLFKIGNDRYALEASHAIEVIPFVALKKIPHAPRGVAGIFNYRGQPVPAIDLCELTSGRPARERLSTRIILTKHPNPSGQTRLLGLIAEHATEMMRRDERDFRDTGVKVGTAPYLGPVIMDNQGVIQLLHASRLAGLDEGVRELLFAPTSDVGELSHEPH
jgi:chemotaxis-related protein WspB